MNNHVVGKAIYQASTASGGLGVGKRVKRGRKFCDVVVVARHGIVADWIRIHERFGTQEKEKAIYLVTRDE